MPRKPRTLVIPPVDPALVERLERALAFGAKRLAVPIDVADVEAVITLLKGGLSA